MSLEKDPEVTFKFYLPMHQDDVYMHVNAAKMYCLLHEIDQKCRNIIKHEGGSIDKLHLAEEIRELIRNEIDVNLNF